MNRKFFILANPASGRQKTHRSLQVIKDFLEGHDGEVEIHLTEKDRTGKTIISNLLDDSFTDLLIIGGDGTINEAVNGMKYDIPVSFYPGGTGNDFVKNLDIGESSDKNLEVAWNGKIHRIDAGICNDRIFLNGVGIGFDGQIVEEMQHRHVPLLSGHAKYYYHVLSILAFYKEREFSLSIDGTHSEKDLILLTVGNGTTFGGGFKLTPQARIDDGKFQVCTVAKISALRRFLNIIRLKNGSHDRLPEVELMDCQSISIGENEMLNCHIDGEPFGNPPFNIRILPGHLRIRANAVI